MVVALSLEVLHAKHVIDITPFQQRNFTLTVKYNPEGLLNE